ncbi:Ada metal-binding domain-containing protein [Candidatus Neomicrothrix sp.]|uniref:Ada metal-binding domain-containing protein n=1 Tax=Candidatus Neomicrothrix sp. TaxID=2719034 RepID=UPI0025C1B038|nr:Ada metal-binding domain-containing protein [Candidatus Microthrix sp.]
MTSLLADHDRCYRAVLSRDRRFDGRIMLAVLSTGICRPSCPTAVRPKRANARFFATSGGLRNAGSGPAGAAARRRTRIARMGAW